MWNKIVVALLVSCTISEGSAEWPSIYVEPQQIHLSLAANGVDMVATWSTEESTRNTSFVKYGTEVYNLSYVQPAVESKFLQENNETGRVTYIHRAVMTGLKPSTVYFYSVGNDITVAGVKFFKTFPNYPVASSWQPQIALFGDMGNVNAKALPLLQKHMQQGWFNAVLHMGDFAYDFPKQSGRVGDEFMRQIQAVAAYVPYMTCPGNHEYYYNFSHYYNRFTMPEEREDRTNMFYSFNVGPVHFVSVNTEYYYFLGYGTEGAKLQYNWLVKDLTEANKPENRKLRPWIILFGHRPMYCSTDDSDDCKFITTATRIGIPSKKIPGMEPLLVQYKVDIALWAHEHTYERLWPIYNYKVVNGSTKEPYTNAKGPIHLIAGSAGCMEFVDPFDGSPPSWSAFRSSDYGYAIMKAHNGSVLEFSQVSVDKNGAIIDHIFVKKDEHQKWYTLEDYENMI